MSADRDPPDHSGLLMAGLCAFCKNAKRIASLHQTYVLCRLAASNPAYEKYPVLPVASCRGFEPNDGSG